MGGVYYYGTVFWCIGVCVLVGFYSCRLYKDGFIVYMAHMAYILIILYVKLCFP